MNYAAMRYVAKGCTVQGAARALLWVISYHADHKTGECTARLGTLAEEAGVSYATAKRAKALLLGCGAVEVVVAGRRPTCLRIVVPEDARAQDEPQARAQSEPVDNSGRAQIEPVDNLVKGSNRDPQGLILPPTKGSNRGSPYKEEKVRTIEGFEGWSAPAPPVDDDPTATAVVVHSPQGNGLPPNITTALTAIKDKMHADLQADRQAQAQRDRDLLGPSATEATA